MAYLLSEAGDQNYSYFTNLNTKHVGTTKKSREMKDTADIYSFVALNFEVDRA